MEALKRLLDGDDALPPIFLVRTNASQSFIPCRVELGDWWSQIWLTLQTRRQNTLQIKQHYNGFHYLNSPLVSVDYFLSIYTKIRQYFPGHCAFYKSAFVLTTPYRCLWRPRSFGLQLVGKFSLYPGGMKKWKWVMFHRRSYARHSYIDNWTTACLGPKRMFLESLWAGEKNNRLGWFLLYL
jgi:hypothetical protein